MSEKKRYTSEQKIIVLRDLLEKNMQISQVAEKHNVHVNDIFNWKKKLFEYADSVFESIQEKTEFKQEKQYDLPKSNFENSIFRRTNTILSNR